MNDDKLISELTTHYLTELESSDTQEAREWAESLLDDVNDALDKQGLLDDTTYVQKRRLAFSMIKVMDAMVEELSSEIQSLQDV